jgi:hypothetical protein
MFLRMYVEETSGCDGWLTPQIQFAFYLSHSFSQSSTPFARKSIDNGNKCVCEDLLALQDIPFHLFSAELYE